MKRDGLKKQKAINFNEELELQLRHIKTEGKLASNAKSAKKREMATLIDDVVFELQEQDSLPLSHTLLGDSKRSKLNYVQIKEIKEMDELEINQEMVQINQESSIVYRERKELTKNSKHRKEPDSGNIIWNLVSQSEVVIFLQDNFRKWREEETISIYDFVEKALRYYTGTEASPEQIYKMKDQIKPDLTTTSPELLSLNALEILAKKMTIEHYILQSYIETKIKLNLQEANRRNKKIMEELTGTMSDLKHREQELDAKLNELYKRETSVAAKEKTMMSRQKEMVQREKEYKRSFEEKCSKLYETNLHQFGDHVKETEKRMVQLEKNIRGKIEIMERRAENLKFLINQQNELKSKKVSGESQARIRLRKLQKETEAMQKRYKSQVCQLKNEERQLFKNLSHFEEKAGKAKEKLKKQKDRVEELETELNLNKGKNYSLQEENTALQQTLIQMKTRIPQQNLLLKGVKPKQVPSANTGTNRVGKSKGKKQHQNNLASVIGIYEHILQSFCFGGQRERERERQRAEGSCMVGTMKEMMPFVINLLCSDEEQEAEDRKPHYLVLFIHQLAVQEGASLRRSVKESREGGTTQGCDRLWSVQLSELLELPFNSTTSCSLFLYMLPILDWDHPLAASYFQNTITLIISQIQQSPPVDTISLRQLQVITSPEGLQYLASQFLFVLTQQLADPKHELNISLTLSSSVVDLFIAISSLEGQRGKLRHRDFSQQLIFTFECLGKSIIGIYNAETKTGRKRNQAIFLHLELIEELSEKLSILIQRIVYHCEIGILAELEMASLSSIYGQLQEINLSNGSRHGLILANFGSILSQFEECPSSRKREEEKKRRRRNEVIE